VVVNNAGITGFETGPVDEPCADLGGGRGTARLLDVGDDDLAALLPEAGRES
jgi:hypothetical protein